MGTCERDEMKASLAGGVDLMIILNSAVFSYLMGPWIKRAMGVQEEATT